MRLLYRKLALPTPTRQELYSTIGEERVTWNYCSSRLCRDLTVSLGNAIDLFGLMDRENKYVHREPVGRVYIEYIRTMRLQ